MIDKEFIIICPRCSKETKVKKTEYYFIIDCNNCKFNMGIPRNHIKKEIEKELGVNEK